MRVLLGRTSGMLTQAQIEALRALSPRFRDAHDLTLKILAEENANNARHPKTRRALLERGA